MLVWFRADHPAAPAPATDASGELKNGNPAMQPRPAPAKPRAAPAAEAATTGEAPADAAARKRAAPAPNAAAPAATPAPAETPPARPHRSRQPRRGSHER